MNVFLLHGMGRSRFSLLPLAARLRGAGHRTTILNYSAALYSFEENAEKLLRKIQGSTGEAPFAIVAHSLGGILTRSICEQLSPHFSRFVMLGPPNRPVVMAKKFARNPAYRLLTGSSGQRLGDDAFYSQLPIPHVPTLIVAGTVGRSDRWSPFEGHPNDGIVSVAETHLTGAEHVTVRAPHTWLMNDPLAQLAVVEFLAGKDPPTAAPR